VGERRLSVATYNVHSCVGTDGRYDPGRVAEVIHELDVDVVGLQELDWRRHAERPAFQLEHLSGSTGYAGVIGASGRDARGEYGNGLLTIRPVLAVRQIDLGVVGREPRGALDVDLDLDGVPVRVVVTHLGLRPFERRRQVTQLLEAVAEDGRPVVLMGDFNEWYPRGSCVGMLRRRFGETPAFRTFPSAWPVVALDRIWASPAGAIAAARVHATRLARRASDHLPVRAELRYGVRS
jgi:endonuclease/exonuclease/phosphatase family metal-dependent hydrolase